MVTTSRDPSSKLKQFAKVFEQQQYVYAEPKVQISCAAVTVQAGLCQTWSETQIVSFLMRRLIFKNVFRHFLSKIRRSINVLFACLIVIHYICMNL